MIRRWFLKKLLFQPAPPANMQGIVSTILWSYVGSTLPTLPTNLPIYSLIIVTGPPDIAYVLLNGSAGPMWVQVATAT
jgi:hypothetical protein